MLFIKGLPNILTIIRIALIPLLLIALYASSMASYWVAALLFAFAILTDYLDGVLARSMGAQTSFGKILDPIADKLLVASTLIMLVYFDRAPVIPAILIVSREIIVSGLREYLSEFKVSIPVTKLAKIKTTIQFAAILILILGEEATTIPFVYYVGEIALWVAAILTLFTGYVYLKEGFSRID
jgi:CDP-diacylglycerol--glycerol-3-phosphate 3-phosphatidyltransferase